jgi:hypothetical protein
MLGFFPSFAVTPEYWETSQKQILPTIHQSFFAILCALCGYILTAKAAKKRQGDS